MTRTHGSVGKRRVAHPLNADTRRVGCSTLIRSTSPNITLPLESM